MLRLQRFQLLLNEAAVAYHEEYHSSPRNQGKLNDALDVLKATGQDFAEECIRQTNYEDSKS